ncbi:hypothetical protein [Clostridium saccharobutylicum]|uniref:Homeodomain phBC6A51-type domain-containing protein n=1 Tax=Clostridium saccharobutylicum DSM 13864 TaxID=1345695 RepID=U5MX06_CLOSA|nr:hypothetical protein [Clostridium saccharobutylicum]AGX43967.1 hypothetical protein CLSA_c30000 [Clostridium saccharobutylicum DSM 13864]AQR91264.1 hypothetical protein CLOSC_29880 [Clostridium saccharobutylicum]AQS01168.1 hypothetical protein CSACC_29950 [Clostridium saccharobutylicum]AQS10581.1 hypothetical protein CLOBY_27260 [Clostridium saccharobutylicum]AQS15151.1 hypothetical protein CLOSACC_29950 [Clostridium saccharobutylicum]
MLTEQQRECIDQLCIGTKTDQEIAKDIGCRRETVSRWKNQNKEFKAELNKRSHDFENGLIDEAQTLLKRKLGIAIDNILNIANDSTVKEETRLKANQYLVDRVLGNTTTKIEQFNTDSTGKNTNVNIEDMLNEIKEDNVIALPKDKVK